jgi:cell division transport system permease protein
VTEIGAILRRSWQSHFWINLATTGVLTLSFSLILGTLLFTSNLGRFLSVWGDEIQITIYLKDTITPEEKASIQKGLSAEVSIESVQYIDKSTAQDSFEQSLSNYGPDFLKAIKSEGENPFPASFLVGIKKTLKTPEKIESLAGQFGQWAGVEDVSYGQEWLKNYATVVRVAKTVSLIVSIILLIGCMFTVSNSVQASLFSRREEIEILELVGATSKKIRWPFIVEGAFQGLVATVASVVLLGVSYQVVYNALEKVLGAATTLATLSFLSFGTVILVTLLGSVIGAAGSYLCVSRINSGWAASQETGA